MPRTAAFGDFLNDYELLREAGTAIAMENAHPKLKEKTFQMFLLMKEI